MATLPLDLDSVLSELGDPPAVPAAGAPGHRSATSISRSRTRAKRSVLRGVLGFDVTVRGYPGALFVSAGGYHHHLGLNTWHSAGSPPPRRARSASRLRVCCRRRALDQVLAAVRRPGSSRADAARRPPRPRPVRQRRAARSR